MYTHAHTHACILLTIQVPLLYPITITETVYLWLTINFALGCSFIGTDRPPSSMYTRLAGLSQEHSRASKRASNTVAPSFFLRKRKKSGLKTTHYVRDVLCLPASWCTGTWISIPRGDRRSYLTENGLLGKIEFSSIMSSKEIILEISRVFGSQVGLSKSDIEDGGKRLNFLFLQRTGAGSRTLCKPSVTESFE